MVVQNVLNYHENNFIMQEIPKTDFGYFIQNTILFTSFWFWGEIQPEHDFETVRFLFAVTIPAIVLCVFSSCYSYQAPSILGIFAVSYPDQPHQISSELLSRMKCEGWHWFEKATFPKSLITVILKRTITTNHSAIILTAAYQHSHVKGTLLSGSSGWSFYLILFCIKEKKTAFHLFFQFFSCHSC